MKNKCKLCGAKHYSKLDTCRKCRFDNTEIRKCILCGNDVHPEKRLHADYENRNYCKEHNYSHRIGKKHNEETKAKIALGNSKPCSLEKAQKIQEANTFKVSNECLQRLHELWSLRCLNEQCIRDDVGLGVRVYNRVVREHRTVEPVLRGKSLLSYDQAIKLIDLADSGMQYKDITTEMGFGHRRVYRAMVALELPINRDPRRFSGKEYSTERFVREWLEKNDIEYRQWVHFEPEYKWEFDFEIVGTSILLEVQGDYYHCNPRVYSNGAINDFRRNRKDVTI